jgi:hypothetical protein
LKKFLVSVATRLKLTGKRQPCCKSCNSYLQRNTLLATHGIYIQLGGKVPSYIQAEIGGKNTQRLAVATRLKMVEKYTTPHSCNQVVIPQSPNSN